MSGDSGWNAVIHHPSELELENWNWDENDGEPERELPSTVDMDAIKGGGSWDPATGHNETDSVDSEEDSDSDEDSSDGSCSYSDSESDDESSGEDDSGSNTDCSSEHSEQTFSIRETNFEPGSLKLKISMKGQKKDELDKPRCEKTKKILTRKSKTPIKTLECTTDDSDSSAGPTLTLNPQLPTSSSALQLSQQPPLQEINQEHLSAIIPEQEDTPFDGFEDSESGRLVSKAIERMSLSADSDSSENTDQNPVPVYSSTLLQQFVEKTALLSEPRKRRSKVVKKVVESEYTCASNVSPDSGIQSVDNSPLHLTTTPASPPAASQSPLQTAPPKPAVNVDRVLYPPKRKPGRPAKTATKMPSIQPRGPGRPRLKPEVVEKIEKIKRNERNESPAVELKKETSTKRTKSTKTKSTIPQETKEDTSRNQRLKNRKLGHTKKDETPESSAKAPAEEKCLNNKSSVKKSAKEPTKSTEVCKRSRQERSVESNKSTSPTRQQKSNNDLPNEDKMSGRKSSKENRSETSPSNTKKSTTTVKKPVLPTPRRILKENKSSKKLAITSETSGVSVQTVISVPVELKPAINDAEADKCDKTVPLAPLSNSHRHKHHHHKHRRRVVAPPKKPIRVDPMVVEELEKLIDEFSKLCSLGKNNTNATHSDLPQIFRVKKITKKRKGGDAATGDDAKLKRRLKKEKIPMNSDSKSNAANASSNPNEQRLPLKKRHYHLSSPHSSQSSNASCTDTNPNESNSMESHIEEAIEATIERYSGSPETAHQKEIDCMALKKRLREAESTAAETAGSESSDSEDKPLNRLELPRRKKKIVRDLRVTVTKLVTTENHSSNEKSEKSSEKTSKYTSEKSNKTDKVYSDKKLEKNESIDKTESKKSDKIDKSSSHNTKETDDKILKKDERKEKKEVTNSISTPVNSLASLILTKKKIRRRKAINRTGFPTLKKKKKKITPINLIAQAIQTDQLTLVPRVAIVTKDRETTKNEVKSVLSEADVNGVLPIVEDSHDKESEDEKMDEPSEFKHYHELSCNSFSDDVSDSCPDHLRTRKDLVECDGSKPCDKLCPVKYEKIQDSRIYDENATLEESLERYNQSQRIGELSEENLKKLERANSRSSSKMDHSCENNNHKRRRGSTSPCNFTLRSIKRLKNAEYDTESDAVPSSDVASDEPEVGKPRGSRKKQPRWKKRYLQAGLFSDYYKEDEPRKVTTTDGPAKHKLSYDPTVHPHGLLPPPHHCGKFLRQRKIPFQLPYDLWWLHTHSRLPGRDLVPSWNYRKIRTNIYCDGKPTSLYETQSCECKPDSGCGDDCINRMVFSECSSQMCPCGERCDNQKIQRHDWTAGLQRFMTDNKGWGVLTRDFIKTGAFILEYVGEVVSEREFKSRMATRYAHDTHHYCLHLDGGLVIDGHRMGGDGRFVNHSCEPNCEMQKWSVHGLPRMALFASRDIKPGEELTYDYNFALFNPSEGQQCKCGSNACRGVIGGKSQRVARPQAPVPIAPDNSERRSVGRPRKNVRKNIVQSTAKGLCKTRKVGDSNFMNIPQVKPMSQQQRYFAQQHHCFLLRNLEKVKRMKTPVTQIPTQTGKNKDKIVPTTTKEKGNGDKTQSDAFISQLSALTNNASRTVRTRRLAQAQDDPEVNKTAKLAKVLKDLYTVVSTAKDENGGLLCTPFISLPSKRKLPDYYEKLTDPIDLTIIDQAIGTGIYKTAGQFDQDLIKLFDNNVKFFGRTSEIGIAAARLRKLYLGSKENFIEAITEATGAPPAQGFLPPQGATAGEEDVIRCICGLHRDEGLMIQCERCLVWQHCDCVKADTSAESYLCERCQPRPVDLEIPLEGEEEEEGKKHFVTLLRGELQLRQGDTVYVLRDTPEKHTYKTIQKFDYEQMDIFRIERLWKNPEGERFVFGHHYLRPHETYHEPTRKFYENEVVCAPLYEAVPCDLVAERCWVLDPHTYCKGRPVGAAPEHIYVCEYRVDRAARLFTKVARSRHQVCTKPYAFETFPQRIKHYRTYLVSYCYLLSNNC